MRWGPQMQIRMPGSLWKASICGLLLPLIGGGTGLAVAQQPPPAAPNPPLPLPLPGSSIPGGLTLPAPPPTAPALAPARPAPGQPVVAPGTAAATAPAGTPAPPPAADRPLAAVAAAPRQVPEGEAVPVPPVPAPPDSVEDRLRRLEELNERLIQQNAELQTNYQKLLERLEAPSADAGDAPAPGGTAAGAGGGVAPGSNPVNLPAAADTSDEGGEGARDNPAELGTPGGPTRIKMNTYFGPGLIFESKDEEFQLQFHNQTQIDGRFYDQPAANPTASGFSVPRQRLIFQGRFTKNLEYEGSVDAGFGTAMLLNAWLNFRIRDDRFMVKAGRFKVPFEYEYYAISNVDLIQPERSVFGANFGLNRETGFMAFGSLNDKQFDYAVGLFNGPRNSYFDYNSAKDVIAYVNYKPFLKSDLTALKHLNLGGSVDFGNQNNPTLPQALTTSVSGTNNAGLLLTAPAFMIWNNDVVERGDRTLWTMHATYFYKQLSLMAEWQGGQMDYAKGSSNYKTQVPLSGFYVSGGYFLTGETVERRTAVKPLKPFSLKPGKRGWGAFEVQGRYAQVGLGDEVFTAGLTDPNLWSNSARVADMGLNWYLNQYIKIYFDWQHSEFGQPVLFAPGREQLTSDLFWARIQIYF